MSEILAIDPGPERSAFVRWQDGARVAECGWLENAEVRAKIALHSHRATIAIEWIQSFGMVVGAPVFATCIEIGRMVEVADARVLTVFRKDVKLHLCGSPRAKDPNIRQALLEAHGPAGTKKTPGPLYGVSGHVWSALAVAVTAEAILDGTFAYAKPGQRFEYGALAEATE